MKVEIFSGSILEDPPEKQIEAIGRLMNFLGFIQAQRFNGHRPRTIVIGTLLSRHSGNRQSSEKFG